MPAAMVSHGYYFAGGKSGNCSRYPLEDWVRQTDHLSIESPVLAGTSSSMGLEGKLPLQDDDDVVRIYPLCDLETVWLTLVP
jgi:hypothetical protein